MSAQPDNPSPHTLSCFVTGTDTGVGKTWVSCALLHALARHHKRVVGMKPVAAGTVPSAQGDVSEDAVALRSASTLAVPFALDNPYLLADPVSPHVAAQRAGQTIDLAHIVACHRTLCQQADAVVVEGAGGFIVPLSNRHTSADLAQALALPVVLVVGLRLGCLNHALLSAEAIRARGLHLAGWVANRIDPTMAAPDDSVAYMREHLQAPCLADIPHGCAPEQAAQLLRLPSAWNASSAV
jgi:dethiobiotin synthetase